MQHQKSKIFCLKLIVILSIALGSFAAWPSVAAAGMSQWTTGGPYGRYATDIAISPNFENDGTALISTYPEMFRTVDFGANWAETGTGLTRNWASMLAVSPTFSADQTIFAATDQDGVAKSVDGGVTWQTVGLKSYSVMPNTSLVAVSPQYGIDQTVIACTNPIDAGVYISEDGGTFWTRSDLSLAEDIAFSPTFLADHTVFAATYDQGLQVSTDGGRTYVPTTFSSWVNQVEVSPDFDSDLTLFVNGSGGIFRSEDGGITWQQIRGAGDYCRIAVSPDFANDNQILLAQEGQVYRSTNRGNTWQPLGFAAIGGISALRFDPNNASKMWISDSRGVWHSADGGASFLEMNNGVLCNDLFTRACDLIKGKNGSLYLAKSGRVFKSNDNASTWNIVPFFEARRQKSMAIDPNNPDRMYVGCGGSDGVSKTVDGGISWTQRTSPGMHDIEAIAVNPSDPNIILASSNADGIFRSTDQGDTWSGVFQGSYIFPHEFAFDPNSPGTIYGAADTVLKSIDNGLTWTNLSGSPRAGSIAVDPNTSAVFACWDDVYRSTDGGATWSLLPEPTVGDASVAASSRAVYVADYSGAYQSMDQGLHWDKIPGSEAVYSGNSAFPVVDPLDDKSIFVVGSGVWQYTFGPIATTLSTSPSASDGTNDWFKTTPAITLARSEPGTTYYSWTSDAGPWTEYTSPLLAPEGESTLYYYSRDVNNNDETVKSRSFKVDTTPPADFTLNLPVDGATVNRPYPYFSWNPSSDGGSGLAKYQLYIGGGLARDNIADWTAAVSSFPIGGPGWAAVWWVRAWDAAGNYTDSEWWDVGVEYSVPFAGKIAFASHANGEPDLNWDIYSMGPSGTNLTRLTSSTVNEYYPAVSPDGSKIAFMGDGDIYVMNADGSGIIRLTSDAYFDSDPCWTPDGSKIVFVSDRAGDNQIFAMNSDGSFPTQITYSIGSVFNPAVSPDGKQLAYAEVISSYWDIWVSDIDGSDAMRLTSGDAMDEFPAFSPDGSMIAFASYRDGNSEIYIMNADGTDPRRLTTNSVWDGQPSFSPAGNRIVFNSCQSDSLGDIWTVNLDGSDLQQLSVNNAGDGLPDWGPGLDTAPPSAPTLSGSASSPTQINLSWTPATDDVGVSEYRIFNANDNSQSASTSGTSRSLTNLSPSTTYRYYVKAYDAAGNSSSPSNTVEVTTPSPGTTQAGQLTNDPATDYYPEFSRDGTKIVFASNRTGNDDIWVMNANGSNQVQLTTDLARDDWPTFSPDGTKIAFHSNRAGNDDIWLMNSDGTNPIQLTTDPAWDSLPAFSPDGSKIAFMSKRSGSDDIWIMNSDGSNPVQLTFDPAIDDLPTFSPDGTKIAFHSTAGTDDIWLMNSDGTNSIQLTTDPAWDSLPAFSPDGTKIVFASSRSGNNDVWIMNSDGSNPVQLTFDPAHDGHPTWNHDGTQVAFASDRSGNRDIWVMQLAGAWTQVNTDGFGTTANNEVCSMAVLDSYLYAGTSNYTGGCEIWRSSNSTTWEQVSSGGFGDTGNIQVLGMQIFNGNLYVGTNNAVTGCEIWRSSDGAAWDQVSLDGFGDSNNRYARAMEVFNGYIYIGVGNDTGGQIWRSANGTTWEQLATGGFGDLNNMRIPALKAFDGYLYAGSGNPNFSAGCEVWRTPDGINWTQVNTDGFGNLDNRLALSMEVFSDCLYAGVRNDLTGCEIWRTSNGTTWEQVASGGFGSPENMGVRVMSVLGGNLYVGTTASFIPSSGIAQVWKTSDGLNWTQFSETGFGDSQNVGIWSMQAFDDKLFAGTWNSSTGGEVWGCDPSGSFIFTPPPPTLHGPASSNDGEVSIYGNASASALVKIYHSVDGEIAQATVDSSGSWHATVTLSAGTHTLTATATLGDQTSGQSSPLTVVVNPTVPEIGVPQATDDTGASSVPDPNTDTSHITSFSWRTINIDIPVSNNPTSVTALINGNTYTLTDPDDDGVYSVALNPGSLPGGPGHYDVQVTVEDASGGTYVQEVMEIELIDPSGYVYDASIGTSARIQGATATLYTSPGGVLWNAALFGQVNPQITDAQGNYGWNVPAGSYYVVVSRAGYTTTTSITVTVPPPVTTLNIGMQPVAAPPGPATGANTYSLMMLALTSVGFGVLMLRRRVAVVDNTC